MGFGKLVDLYDDHPKIRRAWRVAPESLGLHVMSVSHCNRHESDGVVDPEWLFEKLAHRGRGGEQLLERMVELGLYDLLPAGETRTFEIDDRDVPEVTVGPFSEDRYLVHDFLDQNTPSAKRQISRRKDSERKRGAGPNGVRTDSERSPAGTRAASARPPTRIVPASDGTPRARVRAAATETATTAEPPHPPASGGSGRKRDLERARNDYEHRLGIYLQAHPCLEDPARVAAWATILDRLPTSEQTFLHGSHPHGNDDAVLLIGVAPDRLGWVLARAANQNWLDRHFDGRPVEFIECPSLGERSAA